jgi:RNA polymerase subunit RPABC4/transcription elongation factor Spt4
LLRNCDACGRVFVGSGRLCPACLAEEEESFRRVEAFIREAGQPTLAQTAEATGVPVARLRRWVEEGRLSQRFVDATLRCQACGAPIEAGRFCPTCAVRIRSGLGGRGDRQPDAPRAGEGPARAGRGPTPGAPPEPGGPRMYTWGKRRRPDR